MGSFSESQLPICKIGMKLAFYRVLVNIKCNKMWQKSAPESRAWWAFHKLWFGNLFDYSLIYLSVSAKIPIWFQ